MRDSQRRTAPWQARAGTGTTPIDSGHGCEAGASAGEPRPSTQRTDDNAGIWVLCSANTDNEILPCCLLPRGTAKLGRYVRKQ